jgi:hypothetical protein
MSVFLNNLDDFIAPNQVTPVTNSMLKLTRPLSLSFRAAV